MQKLKENQDLGGMIFETYLALLCEPGNHGLSGKVPGACGCLILALGQLVESIKTFLYKLYWETCVKVIF